MTCSSPEKAPIAAPTATAAITPTILPNQELSAATSEASTTPASAMTPSIERSILPSRITKVAPSVRTTGIAEADAMRMKLLTEKKFGLINPSPTQSTSNTISGASRRISSGNLLWRPFLDMATPLASAGVKSWLATLICFSCQAIFRHVWREVSDRDGLISPRGSVRLHVPKGP